MAGTAGAAEGAAAGTWDGAGPSGRPPNGSPLARSSSQQVTSSWLNGRRGLSWLNLVLLVVSG